MADLAEHLSHLADTIDRPREEDGTPATLEALMPCEPAIGDVAVACWSDSAGGELIELVRLDDGARIGDAVALREALTLLAMVETVEELASFDELADLEQALAAWHDGRGDRDAEFIRAQQQAVEALRALAALAPGDAPRVARPALLDQLGGALRELERAWEQLEQAAELWSDAHLATHARDDASVAEVQELWRMLGAARRGPLARPVSAALHDGREAGAAMAAAVAEAARS